jgi:aspartate ammonia-lyase
MLEKMSALTIKNIREVVGFPKVFTQRHLSDILERNRLMQP